MEKRFRKHPVICEEGQISCMFGLISMLDFRQRRLNQGLISNEKLDVLIAPQRRSVKTLMEEEISLENESFSRKIRYGAHDYPVFQCSDMELERTSLNSDQKCLKPFEVLKMNKELCLKLLQDEDTKNLQAETGCGFDTSMITYDSLLKKIKNKHGDRSRTGEFHSIPSTVVVLKPEPRKMHVSEDVSCNCSINSCKPVPNSLKNVKKKKINHPLEEIRVEKKKTEEYSSQFDIVLEAKKHMSKRLSNLVQDGDVFSSQEPPRTLGRILSLPKLVSENSKTPDVAAMKMKLKDDRSQLFQETPRRKSTNGMEKPESEEWTSPVSVLEPFFIDNLSCPSTPGSQWGNSSMHLQPHRLDFEEYSTILSSPDLVACLDDSDTISNYVKSVLQSRPMNWNDIFLKFDQNSFDDEPFFDEMELCKVDSYWQNKLLFDCTNEAFLDVCRSHLGFSSSNLVGWNNELDLFNEINKRVNKQFVPRPMARTLQDLVGEDLMNNTWKWMDLRSDVEDIAIQVVEFIIAVDLIPDTITEFFHLNF